jgi:ankyrin repeat protein
MMLRNYIRYLSYLIVALYLSAAYAGSYEEFFKALSLDDAGTVERLLQRGFDPNSVDEQGQVGLYLALRDGSTKAAEVLLRHPQLQVNVVNPAGETPLMIAALKGRMDWARRLLDLGAHIERVGWGPLHYAASGPQVATVELLLDHGARIDARSPNGSTPLMMAARYGSETSARLLLARGADASLRNERGMTAADFARSAGRDELAAQLAAIVR